MAARIRLKRFGRRHRSFYRINVMDARTPRDGKAIEELGWYDPHASQEDQRCKLKTERVEYWLGVGAQPSETVRDLFKRAGIAVKK